MRSILMALLWSFACFSMAQAQTSLVIYGDDDYPPYSYLDAEGEPRGIYVDLLNIAFAQMDDYVVEIELVPWQRALAALAQGKVFAVFPPYYYPNQRLYIGRYSVPLYEEVVAVFCHSDVLSTHRENWPEDFFGLTVGINQGFALGGDDFWYAIEEGAIRLTEAEGNRHNLLMLMLGRIDCYLNDRFSIRLVLDQLVASGLWRGSLPQEVLVAERHQGHLAFTSPDKEIYPYYEAFIKEFNQVFPQVHTQDQLQEIVDAYLPTGHVEYP